MYNLSHILQHWPVTVTSGKQITTGLINTSYWLKTEQGERVLQGVHPVVSSPAHLQNFDLVTSWLQQKKFPAPQPVACHDGTTRQEIDGKTWRMFIPVLGKTVNVVTSSQQAYQVGRIIGLFHAATKDLVTQLQRGHVGFDFQKIRMKLESVAADSLITRDSKLSRVVPLLIQRLRKPDLPLSPRSVIHGDTKVSNVVFDGSRAIAMIDLDTVQVNATILDVAEAVRSACSAVEDEPANELDLKRARALCAGYADHSPDLQVTAADVLPTTGLIAVNLAARFATDFVEDSYFGFDVSRYESRRAHNRARTLGQFALYLSASRQG